MGRGHHPGIKVKLTWVQIPTYSTGSVPTLRTGSYDFPAGGKGCQKPTCNVHDQNVALSILDPHSTHASRMRTISGVERASISRTNVFRAHVLATFLF